MVSSWRAQQNITDIQTATTPDDLPQLSGQTIHLQGEVVDRLPLLEGEAYQLKDATGMVWVVALEQAPPVGTEATVQVGLQYQDTLVGDRDWGGEVYAIEQQRWLTPETNP